MISKMAEAPKNGVRMIGFLTEVDFTFPQSHFQNNKYYYIIRMHKIFKVLN